MPQKYKDVNVSFDGIMDEMKQPFIDIVDSLFTERPKGLFVMGDVGIGKSAILYLLQMYLKAGVIIEMMDKWLSIEDCIKKAESKTIILSHFKLTGKLREAQREENRDRSNPVTYTPFVFIDDLGRDYEDQNGWNLTLFEEYIDHRWLNALTLFISTNKTKKELMSWDGYARVIDRLIDKSWMVVKNMGSGSRRI